MAGRPPKNPRRPGKTRKATARPRRTPAAAELHRLRTQLDAVRAIGATLANAVGLDALLQQIIPHVSEMMRAERTTLFLFDESSQEIWSKVAQGEETREIRLSLGDGIAGWVAAHRQTVNIPDAYQDPRFTPSVDARTGYRTRSVAATPLVNRVGTLVGVLQVLNHVDGAFSTDDIALLEAIAVQATFAVENARQAQVILDQNRELSAARERVERRRAELDLLYQLEQETAASADLDQLLDSIIVRVCERLRSAAGSVLLSDRHTGRLFFRGVSGERKDELRRLSLEPGAGVVGWVAQTGEPLVVNHPDEDPRHDQNLARKIDFPAQALLAVPLVWDRKVIGAIEVLNPRPRSAGHPGYDLEDLKVLTLIAGQVSRAVALTLERQARQDTERLALVGRMLAGVAHDLRNPMTAISGYAQLMAIDDSAAAREERCARVLAQIDEMTAMINDLLAFARGDNRLHPVTVDVTRLARDVEESLRLHCEPRGIQLAVQGRGGTALVDVGRAKRILFNLAKNAVDVLGSGGKLAVDLDEEAGGLAFRVADDGPGLPEPVQTRLFEPFVSIGKLNGTGLGLSIVKRFVDDHRGTITVESKPAQGTTFFVRLPRAEPPAPEPRSA